MSAADSLRIERERRDQAEKRRIAHEDSLRKAAEAKATKDQIGGLFGGGNKGYSKGNTGKPGNQGDPNGDPNTLSGISIGANFGSARSVVSAPRITDDNSSLEGKVVLAVCVDANGNVISAEFTQKGSTTANSTLIHTSINNAKKWRYSPADIDRQCGTMTYTFKVH